LTKHKTPQLRSISDPTGIYLGAILTYFIPEGITSIQMMLFRW